MIYEVVVKIIVRMQSMWRWKPLHALLVKLEFSKSDKERSFSCEIDIELSTF